jgi:hypothetical protein
LGYGESYLATTLSYGPSASNKYITTYFRTQFTVADASRVRHLTADLMYDDGVVVYLNGHEVARRLVATPTTAATLAGGHEAGNAYELVDLSADIEWLVTGTNTIAVEVHQQAASSSDLVFDLGLALELAPPTPRNGIPRRSTWTYWDRGGEAESGWRSHFYDDVAWSSGAAPIGYGESYLATTVGNRPITTFFRMELDVTSPAAVRGMIGELMYDDGVVVYLNGYEIARLGVPAPSTASTLAAGHEANNRYESFDWSAHRSRLLTGRNVIAVEVHQQSLSSSDLVFDLSLTLDLTGPPPEDITRGSIWSYWDRGGDLGTGWRARTFDDGAWASGAGSLGYGESYHATTVGYGPSASSKYITTYFRRDFTVDDPATVTAMTAELIYDDGVVVYLNGNEIRRLHMPAGTITASTPAPGWETGNVYETYDWSSARGFLVAGANVLAVEVHQQSPSSSDLTFDLALNLSSGACATPPVGNWTGTSGEGNFGSGGGEEDRADVTWTLSRSDGCVDHYTPSGTAYRLVGAHYCWDAIPASAPIEPGDGELIVDRSTSPATYTMWGVSEWPGFSGCADDYPDGPPMNATLHSEWALFRGAFDSAVMSGGFDEGGHTLDWRYTRVGTSFPVPSGCVEPPSEQWSTDTVANNTIATVTWTRVSTTGCRDVFEPAGVVRKPPWTDDSPYASCRTVVSTPETSTVEPDDGTLTIDRSTNPPTFDIEGFSSWEGTTICTTPDGTAYDIGQPGGLWVMAQGSYQGNRWSGGLDEYQGPREWTFTRL